MCGSVRPLLAAAVVLGAAAQAPPQPMWLSRLKQANVANCVVDVGLASTMLGKAGVAINAAIQTCGREGDDSHACATAVSGVVAGFSYGAAFISAAAAECRASLEVVNAHAVLSEACAASTSMIVATLSLMVNAGTTIADTCAPYRYPLPTTPGPTQEPTPTPEPTPNPEPTPRPEPTEAPNPSGLEEGLPEGHARRLAGLAGNRTALYAKLAEATRKLQHAGLKPPARFAQDQPQHLPEGGKPLPDRTGAQNAACAMDVGQFTFYMARAGLMINYAVRDCSERHLYEGGNVHNAKCVADTGRAIGAFGYTASGIAYAVYECPDIIDNLDAACAGGIINLVAATAELMGHGANILTTCQQLALGPAAEEKVLRSVASPERRLAASSETNSSGGGDVVV